MMNWQERKADTQEVLKLSQKLGISSLLSRILINRNINTPEKAYYFLNGDFENTLSPFLFQDMKKTVEYLRKVIHDKRPIYIVGDKDVDGITGTAILYHFFSKVGLSSIFYNLPADKESYGFSERIFQHITQQANLDTVLTVDCGIKENDFIKQLNDKSINTIVTDHHTPSEKIPEAFSIINPHLEKYDMNYLSGAAVAFKLVQGLYFSYHSFFNQKILFLTDRGALKGMLAENFVPEREDLEFGNLTGLREFLGQNSGIYLIAETETLNRTREAWQGLEMKVLDFNEMAAHKLKVPQKQITLEKVAQLLKIYFEPRLPQKTLFSLMKKIFFKYYLRIEDKLSDLLKYATLGTVCDYMPLNSVENHIIVKTGLDLINKEMPYYIKLMASNKEKIDIRDIGFGIGPLLNSSGRLGQPQVSLNFLLEDEKDKMDSLYTNLKRLNEERKKHGERAYQEAIHHIETYQKEEDVLFYHSSSILQGITGIIATKICTSYKKTSFIFSVDENGQEIVGSGRSFGDLDLLNIIGNCENFFSRFGGHKKACGMTFPLKYLDDIMSSIRENTAKYLHQFGNQQSVYFDMEISPDQIRPSLLQELKKMYPYGPSNEEPVFYSKKLTPYQIRLIGKDQNHLRFKVKENPAVDFLGWKMADQEELVKNNQLDIIYNLQENLYQSVVYLQAPIIEMKISQ